LAKVRAKASLKAEKARARATVDQGSLHESYGDIPGDQQEHQGYRHLANHEEIACAEAAVAAQRRLETQRSRVLD
jgi:hypothetical protein